MAIGFASIFKRLRVQAGYSQKEEADLLSGLGAYTNNAHVSRWENGSNNPSLEQFIALCSLYHIRNVRAYFGDMVMTALTGNLNEQGVSKLLEFHDVLVEDPRYTVNPGNFGPNTFALTYDTKGSRLTEDDELPDAGEPGVHKVPLYALASEDPEKGVASEMVPVPSEIAEDVLYAVSARDDAMAPAIGFGDSAFILNRKAHNGDAVLVRFNGNLYIRRYLREKRSDWLLATNDAYMPIRITPADTVQVLGVVLDEENAQHAVKEKA